MALFKKLYWWITPILMMLFMFLFDQFYETNSLLLKGGVSAIFAYALSPRKKTIQTQTGEKTQITWFLLKEPIPLD